MLQRSEWVCLCGWITRHCSSGRSMGVFYCHVGSGTPKVLLGFRKDANKYD